ncbi:MAG: hypothetical protein OXG64_06890 [Chloroflexi bacterium]|nr:hypothetical protein [Chloroflexota bacterium]
MTALVDPMALMPALISTIAKAPPPWSSGKISRYPTVLSVTTAM